MGTGEFHPAFPRAGNGRWNPCSSSSNPLSASLLVLHSLIEVLFPCCAAFILLRCLRSTGLNQLLNVGANRRCQTLLLRCVRFDEFNRKLPIPQASDVLLQPRLVLRENLDASGSPR